MKYKIIIVAILILLGNQKIFSQNSFIKGKYIGFETSYVMPGVSMSFHTHSGEKHAGLSDANRIFELEMQDDSEYLIIRFVGSYAIKILNIPEGHKQVDFGEIKIVDNYEQSYQLRMDGTTVELSEEETDFIEKKKRDVLEKYRIKVLGKELKPYFDGKYLVFDFNRKE